MHDNFNPVVLHSGLLAPDGEPGALLAGVGGQAGGVLLGPHAGPGGAALETSHGQIRVKAKCVAVVAVDAVDAVHGAVVAIVDTSHHHPAMSPTRRVEVDPATVGVLDPSLAVLSSPLVVLHCPLLVLVVLTSPASPMMSAVVLVVVVMVGWLDDTHPAVVLVVAPVIVLTVV